MKLKLNLLLLTITILGSSFAQVQVYPTNWWAGMKTNKVQLLIKNTDNFSDNSSLATNYLGVKINKISTVENKKYLLVDITLASNIKPGIVSFNINKTSSFNWEIKSRRKGRGTEFAQGVSSKDFVYLIMPERFSNGDKSNDKIAGLRDQTLNRDSMYHRHGGDLQGISNNISYLKNMGVTTIWMMPVLINDQPTRSEHGYAFTNHYEIEPRFGGAKAYKKLSDDLHNNGMKLIQDAVYNHVGDKHILFLDKPADDWFHKWPSFTQTSYKDQPIVDIYASNNDKKITQDGWFTKEMPDWNHDNPFVQNYLTQHAIWCIEEFGIDGWRIDTYLYNDLKYMNSCNAAIINEYPKMTMFGETWVHGVPSQAYFAQNNVNTPFKSNLQGVTDFQTLFYGIQPSLNEKFGWTDGVNKLYSTLAFDYLYKDANKNNIFLDNHDLGRFYSIVNEDISKLKTGLAWLLTCRGIPQLYYGTEILMKGYTNPDGNVRLDFAGGWQGDIKNAFTGEGLTDAEKDMQQYIKTLANFRLKSSAIKTGKMMQYVPKDGLYVYFRYDEKQTVMCVMNTDEKEHDINFDNFDERTKGFSKAKEVVTKNTYSTGFKIPAKTMWVMELEK